MAKIPTNNLVAYDYFLRGMEFFNSGSRDTLEEGIFYFKKAIDHDPTFARAYGNIAISYYYLDIFKAEKNYIKELNSYADQALLYGPKLPESLTAKGMYYLQEKKYEEAVPYFEKALEYNPNAVFVINLLSDFYTNIVPNTEKYLEYALKGVMLNTVIHDSTSASYTFLHLSNALIQTGFVEEAEKTINQLLITLKTPFLNMLRHSFSMPKTVILIKQKTY